MRNCFLACSLVFAALVASASTAFSQTASPNRPAPANTVDSAADSNDAAISGRVAASIDFFNKKDAKALAACWTETGEYINEEGLVIVGRNAIEAYFLDVFANNPNAKLQLLSSSVRTISESVAIEDGRISIQQGNDAPAQLSDYTATHIKVNGTWLVGSMRDTAIDAPSSQPLSDLNWLIGDWISEENGVTTLSTCRWISNNQFVERSYKVTRLDGTQSTGTQIIGWNASTGKVHSWTFSPDGGHAEGAWAPTDRGWVATVRGTTGAGQQTTALNILQRLDDNAYVWRSIHRTIDDASLPDTDEVIVKRQLGK